ncbi:MAG: hypothetical protein U0Q12_27485 [Vicinamibacterales bacterium]
MRAGVRVTVVVVALACLTEAGCAGAPSPAGGGTPPPGAWTFDDNATALARDPILRGQIAKALDAAERGGTDPSISKYQVRASTVLVENGVERVVVGGNSEYAVPEAIHGETSLVNHAISVAGPAATKASMRFLAFYGQSCGVGGSCGDCRDYLMATTAFEHLLIACGNANDRTVHLQRFADELVAEDTLPVGDVEGVSKAELEALAKAAREARTGGVSLFTDAALHSAAAVLSHTGKIYVAAGTDDAAFHYRFPIGGALQQAATARDYLIKAVAVAGPSGQLPRVFYRDRQYGYEFSSFNQKRGKPPIQVVLLADDGRHRVSTFEAMLPGAFSAAKFKPDAVDTFLGGR